MKSLPKKLEDISFVFREKADGQTIKNRCGRDFLYYGLNYYLPEKFNNSQINPQQIEQRQLFGIRLPAWLMWTHLQFLWLSKYLKDNGLKLYINDKEIKSIFSLLVAILFSKTDVEKALAKIRKNVETGRVVGVDVGLKYEGLLDHIMFVYGYDDDSLYVCDTHKVPILEYEKIADNKFFMKLPIEVVRKRWARFGRVWELIKI